MQFWHLGRTVKTSLRMIQDPCCSSGPHLFIRGSPNRLTITDIHNRHGDITIQDRKGAEDIRVNNRNRGPDAGYALRPCSGTKTATKMCIHLLQVGMDRDWADKGELRVPVPITRPPARLGSLENRQRGTGGLDHFLPGLSPASGDGSLCAGALKWQGRKYGLYRSAALIDDCRVVLKRTPGSK